MKTNAGDKPIPSSQEEWYSIPLENDQNLHQSIPKRTQAVLQVNVGPTPK
jgi:hypothetical protein